ncbi:MAG: hypothetical protein ABSH08_03485 [Tepidisphaeraceae bacterium]|jgi:hypothetical protein
MKPMTGSSGMGAGGDKPPRGDLISISHGEDRAMTCAALAVFAVALGYAVDVKDGDYSDQAIFWVTVSLALCVAGIVAPRLPSVEGLCRRWLPMVLAVCVAIETYFLLRRVGSDGQITLAFVTVGFLGLLQYFKLRGLRLPLMVVMVLAFCVAGEIAFNVHAKDPRIDVFMFQMNGCWALRHGLNPYTFRYPSMYPPGTPYYGAGVVDGHGMLTVGFPYPPLSLLLTMPGYLLGGDVRYSHLAAMGLSAGLIAAARPGRVAALAATMLLLMSTSIYVLDLAWTEPLLVLTFSFFMFCLCRWPKAVPYALGLYFSTKQYTILTLPLLPLIVEGPNHWRMVGRVLLRAGLVVVAINLPFLIWNAHEFIRAVFVFQLLQPFRNDALSYLVWIRQNLPGLRVPIWISLVPLVVMIPLCLRRVASSPAGFAAAVALVHLLFFAFNKQAFGNYYYFVIATACWSIAVARLPEMKTLTVRRASPPATREN